MTNLEAASGQAPAEPLGRFARGLLSAHVLNGASAAIGMFLVAALVFVLAGQAAAVTASVGAIVVLLGDGVHARRGKFGQLLAAPLLGLPLYFMVSSLRGHPLELGLLLLPATFLAFLLTAWGRRGMPVTASVMFAVLLALAPAPAASLHEALLRTAWCALGAGLYLGHALAANAVLNRRYRHQVMADLLFTVAGVLRAHVRRIRHDLMPVDGFADAPVLVELLRNHAVLADELQVARDLILEPPHDSRNQRLAGMLLVVLEMRDRLLATELDIERINACHADVVHDFADILRTMALDVEQVADALLRGRKTPAARDHHQALADLLARRRAAVEADPGPEQFEQLALVRSVGVRIQDQNLAVLQLARLARGEAMPDMAAVDSGWRLFVNPAHWSLQPLLRLWYWRQPALRHAIRAALAVGAGYALAYWLPWASRDYWVLMTIVVVLRGSLAQTLDRRDQRVLGTMLGSLLAAGLLALQPPAVALVLAVVLAQGVAHAFAARHYTVTAVAASVLGLVLAQLLDVGGSPASAMLERVGDTLLGAGIAWGFSYVLPMWEREQLAGRVRRVGVAMARHARHSLALAERAGDGGGGQPELAWRLARREAYDALSALVQTTSRAMVEPRAVRPPLALLERLQGHGYQLLGQLSAIQSLLLLRRDRLQDDLVAAPIGAAARELESRLDLDCRESLSDAEALPALMPALLAIPEDLPDPFLNDASPWLLRRLRLAMTLAQAVRRDALAVLAELEAPAR